MANQAHVKAAARQRRLAVLAAREEKLRNIPPRLRRLSKALQQHADCPTWWSVKVSNEREPAVGEIDLAVEMLKKAGNEKGPGSWPGPHAPCDGSFAMRDLSESNP